MKVFVFLSYFLCCSFLKLNAQRVTSNNERDIVAENTLHNFILNLNADNVTHFGFRSTEELKSSSISTPPFEIFIVSVMQLKNYNNATNVSTMLIRTPRYIYPIINSVNQEVVNAMIVDNPSGREWKMVSMGRDKELAAAIYLQSRARKDSYFVVSISAFHKDFIGYYVHNELMMIPVGNDLQHKMEARRPLPAQSIFSVYSQEAKKYNGLPM